MIPTVTFGRTEHGSSRAIFGSYALGKATQVEADRVLEMLREYGVNHVDTAPNYGNAEKCIGPWMENHRDEYFLATKSYKRTYDGAWADLQRSRERLRVDHVDLWQMHGLTSPAGWEKAMGPGGALEAFVEARDRDLVRFLGVTGHGLRAPAMHLRSLERFDFDSVLLAYNYALMQNRTYAEAFEELASRCRETGVAIQTIKSVARRPWGERPRSHNTYFYEPLESQLSIDHAVHWVLGNPDVFLVTAGDMQVLPRVLDAASRFEGRPSDAAMEADDVKYGIEPIFA